MKVNSCGRSGGPYVAAYPDSFKEPEVRFHSELGDSWAEPRVTLLTEEGQGLPCPFTVINSPAWVNAWPGTPAKRASDFLCQHGVTDMRPALIQVEVPIEWGDADTHASAVYLRYFHQGGYWWRLVTSFRGVNDNAERARLEAGAFRAQALGKEPEPEPAD